MQRYERHISAAATIVGAVFDQIFFARVDLVRTHYAFLTYVAVCFVSIPVLHWIEARAERGIPRPRFRAVFPIATQFALGGFWSGFLVFYGRSAVISASWPFLLVLVAMFFGNEILKKYHERLVFTSVLFFFALYSYAIFAIPLLTGTMGTWVFLLSGAVAIVVFWAFVLVLRFVARERFRADVWRIRAGALFVLGLINLFYFTNILPPLPLSAKAAGIYHSVWRVPGDYLATAETDRSLLDRYLGLAPTMHVVSGESLYAYSEIFAPTTLSTTIVHRWQWYDPSAKKWVTKTAITYPIVGGRDGGYRGYSATLAQPGKWRVNVETIGGLLIARIPFTVEEVQLPPPEETINLD